MGRNDLVGEKCEAKMEEQAASQREFVSMIVFTFNHFWWSSQSSLVHKESHRWECERFVIDFRWWIDGGAFHRTGMESEIWSTLRYVYWNCEQNSIRRSFDWMMNLFSLESKCSFYLNKSPKPTFSVEWGMLKAIGILDSLNFRTNLAREFERLEINFIRTALKSIRRKSITAV